MPLDRFTNFCIGTLSTGIDGSQTYLDLQAGDGSRFPSFAVTTTPCQGIVYNATDFPDIASDPNAEIIRITGRSSDRLTPITRGQEGTAAVAHNAAGKTYKVLLAITKKCIDDLDAKISGLTQCSFRAHLASNASIASGSWQKVPFSKVPAGSWDAHGDFTTATSRFTAPATGYYLLSASVYFASMPARTSVQIEIQQNGAQELVDIRPAAGASSDSGAECWQVTGVVSAVAGDYFECGINHNAGSAKTAQALKYLTYFAGHSLFSGT